MQDVIASLQKALIFLFKPGNLLYWLLPAIGGYLALWSGSASLVTFLPLLLGILMQAKMMDSATRIINGHGDEDVPMQPLTVLPLPVAAIVVGGALVISFAVIFIAGLVGMGMFAALIMSILLPFLLPLWLLAVSYTGSITSLFAPDELGAALSRIGAQRYVAVVGIPVAIGVMLTLVYQFILMPLVPNIAHLPALLLMLINALPGALAMVAWAYLLREEESGVQHSDGEISDMDFSDIVMDSNLLAAMAEGRADDIPEGDISPVRVESSAPAKAEKTGLLSRLRKKEPQEAPQQMPPVQAENAFADNPFEELRFNIPQADHTAPAEPPKKAERKILPPDMSLLAEADVQDLDLEEQLLFVRDLMDADRLWQDGDLLGAENLLDGYTGYGSRITTYFPAFKRLDRIYRQQGREDERHALHTRMLSVAAAGYQPAYHLIHAHIAAQDVAAMQADWIYPLAQQAAAEGHYDNVLHLTKNFARNHPNHAHIVDNYFLAARALEKRGNLNTAQQLLAQLLQRYPDHARIGQIRATHDLLAAKIQEG